MPDGECYFYYLIGERLRKGEITKKEHDKLIEEFCNA